jgi:hypothetical protein
LSVNNKSSTPKKRRGGVADMIKQSKAAYYGKDESKDNNSVQDFSSD